MRGAGLARIVARGAHLNLLLLTAVLAASGQPARITLTGAGATSLTSLYDEWFAAYGGRDPSVNFRYLSVGSGKGQHMIADRQVDFSVSDSPMSSEALANAPEPILHVPVVGGADVVTFNLHGLKELRLDGPTLADIYLGKIKQWNDAAIARLNPGTRLPDVQITVAHRSDASGSTYVLTDYLCSMSQEWKLKVGRYMVVNWPAGVGLVGNAGVANYVKKTPGAIGSVELVFAERNQLTQASIRNAAGVYVKANNASITAALATAEVPPDFRLSIVNSRGSGAYPIANVTWMLVFANGAAADRAKTAALVAFLRWVVSDGQKIAEASHFAPLSSGLRERVLQEIGTIPVPN